MNKKLATVCLPNNQKVFCLQKEEAKFLYEEVQGYLKHEITVKEGDIIFDVGANIGLFALMVDDLCSGKAKILAFEPVPATFRALDHNANKFNPRKIKTFQFGLGKRSQTVEFSWYPNLTAMSSLYPDYSGKEKQHMATIIKNGLDELSFPFYLIKFLPKPLLSFSINRLVDLAFSERRVECQIKTVSQVINEQSIEQIDLLKIDVEKAELDVLEGIDAEDWSKIKQLVIEVHDIDHRVEQIIGLLTANGFSKVLREQDPALKHVDIYSIYALR